MKPLGRKNYGHIGHLPGSRLGPGDHRVPDGQARICLTKTRDKHDVVIVQEKLDGSNVGVALHDGQILALGRSGYLAQTAPYEQHQLFAAWVREREQRFRMVLAPGERIVGEWLAQAHGTRYALRHEPFVAFEIMVGETRLLFETVQRRLESGGFIMPHLLGWDARAISLDEAGAMLGHYGHHGALERAEGMVYRVERQGKVDFLAKYVRSDKQPGCLLPEETGQPAVWNWRPVA